MRHPLLCLLGLVCMMMALAFATSDANALTPLGKKADQASLATQSFDNQSRVISPGDNAQSFQLAWRSTANDGEISAALQTKNLANNLATKIDVNQVANARGAPILDAAALAQNYPNHFNRSDTNKAVVATHTAETTLTVATDGGQPQCRAVMFATNPVGKIAPKKMAA